MKKIIIFSLCLLSAWATRINCVPKSAAYPQKPATLPVEVKDGKIEGQSLLNNIKNWLNIQEHDNDLKNLGSFKFDNLLKLEVK